MSEDKEKKVFDEQPLAKLLEAAYVLQEHNRRLADLELRLPPERVPPDYVPSDPVLSEPAAREPFAPPAPSHDSHAVQHTPPPQDDYTHTLAEIVETQHQIQVRHLELDKAIALVAERTVEIARAHGAAIGMLAGKNVSYRAESGLMTLPAGTEVPMDKALCVASLRTGQVIRCTDVATEFLLDADECRRRGIQSLIAVPVYHDGGIAGALELYYPSANGFSEQDVHTCQLMAGLVTEALARDDEMSSRKSLADERAAVLEALEKLKPNLAALVDSSKTPSETSRTAAATTTPSTPCAKCGNQLLAEEIFCGKCGQPRSSDYGPPDLQSKVASLWHMQEAKKKAAAAPANGASAHSEELALRATPDDSSAHQTPPEPKTLLDEMESFPLEEKPDAHELVQSAPHADAVESPADAPENAAAWKSAASAKDFLEQLAHPPSALERIWKNHRGDIALAAAVILVACVIRWGIWANHPVSATGNPGTNVAVHRAPDADLGFWDRLMIKLGLADPPDPPVDNGNPDTQVWIDLRTGLYYCPGTDLYGKSPKGKYSTQRGAQLDSFESATRKPCN